MHLTLFKLHKIADANDKKEEQPLVAVAVAVLAEASRRSKVVEEEGEEELKGVRENGNVVSSLV